MRRKTGRRVRRRILAGLDCPDFLLIFRKSPSGPPRTGFEQNSWLSFASNDCRNGTKFFTINHNPKARWLAIEHCGFLQTCLFSPGEVVIMIELSRRLPASFAPEPAIGVALFGAAAVLVLAGRTVRPGSTYDARC